MTSNLTKKTMMMILFLWAMSIWPQMPDHHYTHCAGRGLTLEHLPELLSQVGKKLRAVNYGIDDGRSYIFNRLTWQDINANLHSHSDSNCDKVTLNARFVIDTATFLGERKDSGERKGESCFFSGNVFYDASFSWSSYEKGGRSLIFDPDSSEESFEVSNIERECTPFSFNIQTIDQNRP